MKEQVEERWTKGIAKQIGLLKSEIQNENRKSLMLFLLGVITGQVLNLLVELLKP